MRVAVIGGTGLLGRYVARELDDHGHEVSVWSDKTDPAVDAGDRERLTEMLDAHSPDAVVYLAAVTDLLRCKRDPEAAWRVNAGGARVTAQWTAGRDAACLYVSTDSVFRGDRGNYTEHDEVDPLNDYAITKFLGERHVLGCGGTVVRTNFLGAGTGSLLEWLVREFESDARVTGYTDVVFSPLYAGDLATVLRLLIEAPVAGLLHAGGTEAVSKFEVAKVVHETIGSGHLEGGHIDQDEVVRPLNTVLDSSVLRGMVEVPDRSWDQTVRMGLSDIEEGVG